MIVVVGRVQTDPARRETVLEIGQANARASRGDPGCISYRFYEDTERANEFVFIEEWESEEALQQHFATPHIAEFMRALPAALTAPPERAVPPRGELAVAGRRPPRLTQRACWETPAHVPAARRAQLTRGDAAGGDRGADGARRGRRDVRGPARIRRTDGRRSATLRRSIDAALLARNVGDAPTQDRHTKRLLLGGMLAGLAVAWLIAKHAPALRAAANTWATLALGMAVALAGIGLRMWGVMTLGRHFQREVVIEADQTLITAGPYRWVRHPAYAGNLLTVFGFGLMLGSWVGAAVGAMIAFVALLPRVRVEEQALSGAFGDRYTAYAAATARLVPGLW